MCLGQVVLAVLWAVFKMRVLELKKYLVVTTRRFLEMLTSFVLSTTPVAMPYMLVRSSPSLLLFIIK